MTGQLSRNAQVLKYFSQMANGLGHVRLQKLAYLADVEARELLGHPLSEFEYIWYDLGPFDSSFYTALEELEGAGLIRQQVREYGRGKQVKLVKDTREPAVFDFTDAELEVLNYVAKTFMKTRIRELLDEVVYETLPMQDVRSRDAKGDPLRMELVDNVQRNKIGFDLGEILEAEKRMRAGRRVDAPHFFADLRAEINGVSTPVG